jgi:hypothetical protein
MKYPPTSLGLALCFTFTLAACGDKDDNSSTVGETPTAAGAEQAAPQTKRTVKANETAKQAAVDRLAAMQQITAALKPLREPAAALASETELKVLFDEYHRLGKVAADQGIEGRLLDALTAHLAPEKWRDTRTEFQQYMLLVRGLGQPQKEMMERVMDEGAAE